MSEHVTRLLGAFHDGELRGKQLDDVRGHLAGCKLCQSELNELQALSNTLAHYPTPSHLTPGEQFVAQVALQMPRTPDEPAIKKALNIGWQATPFGILGVWAFVQSLLIVSGVIFLLMQLGLDLGPIADLLSSPSRSLSVGMLPGFEGVNFNELGRTAIEVLSNGGPLGWGPMLYVALIIILGLLYCSWIASWWVRQKQTA